MAMRNIRPPPLTGTKTGVKLGWWWWWLPNLSVKFWYGIRHCSF